MYQMFDGCTKLASLDVTNFDTSTADPDDRMHGRTSTFSMFGNCPVLEADIVHYDGTSLTLNGRIETVFHIYEKGYFGDDSSQNLAKIFMSGPNSDIVITDLGSLDVSNGRMKCVYPLDATQANENVTLKVYDENGKQLIMCNYYGTSYYYSLCSHCKVAASVNDYLTAIKNNYSYYKTDAKLQILVSAIENYCNDAENYFKGTKHEINEYSYEYNVTVEPFAPEFGNDVKISLVVNSSTAVRIYTNASDVKIDGNDITPKTTKYGKCYEIANIPAHKLLGRYTLTIGGIDYKFSPMSYVYRTVNSESASKMLKDTAWAAYMYSNAANAYIK